MVGGDASERVRLACVRVSRSLALSPSLFLSPFFSHARAIVAVLYLAHAECHRAFSLFLSLLSFSLFLALSCFIRSHARSSIHPPVRLSAGARARAR